MRYSNYLGAIFSLLLIVGCFTPWVYIESIHTTITGFFTPQTNFGRPGLLHVLLCIIALIMFLVNRVGAKRGNIFICALNFAWALKNFLLITRCELGECPEKEYGIYLIIIFSFFMLIMSFLPVVKETPQDK